MSSPELLLRHGLSAALTSVMPGLTLTIAQRAPDMQGNAFAVPFQYGSIVTNAPNDEVNNDKTGSDEDNISRHSRFVPSPTA